MELLGQWALHGLGPLVALAKTKQRISVGLLRLRCAAASPLPKHTAPRVELARVRRWRAQAFTQV